MRRKILILSTLFVFCGQVFTQNTVNLRKLNATKPIPVQMPVAMEQTNIKGEKFETKELLATEIELPTQADFVDMIDGFDNTMMLERAESEYQIQFFSFNISSDRYAKATVKVTTPTIIELYVDGKKEGTKSVSEDDMASAKNLKKEISLLPYQSRQVIIKLLSNSALKGEQGIEVEVAAEKEYKEANLSISYDGKRRTKVNDGLEGIRATSIKTSPNGDYALVTYRAVDSDGKASIYTDLVNTKTNASFDLGNKVVNWMPKSNMYYYTEKQLGSLQLITIDPNTRIEKVLSKNIPSGNFVFSPNEQFLIYMDKEKADDRKGDFKLLASPEDRQPNYKERGYLSLYDFKTKTKQRLTFGEQSTSLNSISEDSRYILYSTDKEVLTERPFSANSFYLLDISTLQVDTLLADQKFLYRGKFSPDGKSILFIGAPEAFDGVGQNIAEGQIANSYDTQAFLFDIQSKKVDPITKEFNPTIQNVYWNKQDNLIYMTTIDKDCEPVYSYNPKSRQYKKLDMPESLISSFSLSNASSQVSYIGKSISNPTRVYTYDLKSGKSTLINDPTKEMLSNVTLGEVKDWSFTASDGTTIEGFYHLPPDFDPAKKYPLIVYYYGGTTPTPRVFEHPYSMHNFASLGYVVYTIQPSGAIGYGQEFSARHVNAWGKRTADDIIEGTKQFLEEHSFINNEKIGCVGASYGGFMTMYLQTQTDIFKAAISHAGISSLASYWGEGYWGYTYSSGASAHSYPWNNKELYIEQSPLFKADKVNTPILFTHGTVDTNVPIGESIQMYTALKILGKPVEFLEVKGENHGIVTFKKRIEWSHYMYAWFDKWLKDQPQWWDDMAKKA